MSVPGGLASGNFRKPEAGGVMQSLVLSILGLDRGDSTGRRCLEGHPPLEFPCEAGRLALTWMIERDSRNVLSMTPIGDIRPFQNTSALSPRRGAAQLNYLSLLSH